jgi:hypothetical protein
MYISTGVWVDFNIMAGTATTARVAPGTSFVLSNGAPYYIATDGTIHQAYVNNGSCVDFNITASQGAHV